MMDQSTISTDGQITSNLGGQRRSFLKAVSGGIVGASVLAAGVGKVNADPVKKYAPLWQSSLVLIGNSVAPQNPSSYIECPMFFANGHFADASHSLDLTNLENVIGTVTYNNETVVPDFGANIAATPVMGFDEVPYVLVGGTGTVSGGTGFFETIDTVIIRCKYEVTALDSFLLIRCIDCVAILARS